MDVFANYKLSTQKQQQVTQSVTDVSIEWLTGPIRILPSESNETRIIQLTNGKLPEAKLFQYEVIDGRLSIVDGRKKTFKIGLHTVGSPVVGKSLTCNKLHLRAIYSKIDLFGSYRELDAHTSGRGLTVRSSSMLT